MFVSRFQIPRPPRWAFVAVALAAFAFLLRVYIGIWTPEHGITKFLRVGREFDDRGTVVFFSMATSFSAVALGAEGVGKDATLLVGNGYAQGHVDLTLGLLRQNAALRELFAQRYS